MKNTIENGLYLFKQDCLQNILRLVSELQENVYTARNWLDNMAFAAKESGVNIQYSMNFPNFILQTIELPDSISNARASSSITCMDDLFASGETWEIK